MGFCGSCPPWAYNLIVSQEPRGCSKRAGAGETSQRRCSEDRQGRQKVAGNAEGTQELTVSPRTAWVRPLHELTHGETRSFWSLVWVGYSTGTTGCKIAGTCEDRADPTTPTPILHMKKLWFREDSSTPLVLQLWSISRET